MTALKLPPPPVPQRLREMLHNYPEHIEVLQNDLNELVAKPLYGTPMFEQAIWALEGALEEFIDEARTELQAAQASGDAEAIAKAEGKLDLMFDVYSSNGGMSDLNELYEYLQTNKRAFE